MKMRSLLINFVAFLIIGAGVFAFLNMKNKASVYTPRKNNATDAKGMQEWLLKIRANPKTGKVDYDYIAKMNKVMAIYDAEKSENNFELEWIEMGPDKVGGRTRSILIDKKNNNIIYAGSVSGGLWKSVNAGGSWKQINDFADNLVISSIVQTENGDIYYGTGEFWGTEFIGAGIWKSTDGNNFEHLSSSSIFKYVNDMEVAPSGNKVYAATDKGLYITIDGGNTWTQLKNGNAIDVAVASDGTVFTSVNGNAYKSTSGEAGSFNQLNNFPTASEGRMIFAIAPSDPNYIYCSIAFNTYNNPFGEKYQDFDILRSTDQGESWESIRGAYVETFQPFKHQAFYDNIIAVYPNNKNKILLGGIELYSWNNESTTWEKISTWIGINEINYLSAYMHADLHTIVFHPNYNSNKTIFFGNDGGVFKSEDGAVRYTSMNLNYNVTQFYDIGAGPEGRIIAGSQDNGTQYNKMEGSNKLRTTQVLGGDGFSCDISKLNNEILFGSLYYGRVNRILIKEGSVQQMNPQNLQNPFHTDFSLWESFYDPYSIDSIYYEFDDSVKERMVFDHDTVIDGNTILAGELYKIFWVPGDTIIAKSAAGLKPIPYVLQQSDLLPGSNYFKAEQIVKVQDTYQAALAVGLREGLKLSSLPVNLAANNSFRFKLIVNSADIGGTPENITWATNGDIIYFSINTVVYRVSNIKAARQLFYVSNMRKKITIYNKDLVRLQMIGTFPYKVTSIAVDPKFANNVLVTLGSYSSGNHLYYSTNAAVTNSSTLSDNFISVQGSLPEIPAFSSIIAWDDSRKAVIGTEYGIYSTDDITASSVSWIKQDNGMPNVAVYSLTQQIFPNSWKNKIFNHGFIYAGTFGRGAFRSESNAGPVDVPEIPESHNSSISNMKIYPNPVSEVGNIKLSLTKHSDVFVDIYSLSGTKVYSNVYNGHTDENIIKFNVAGLENGVYFVKVTNLGKTKVAKIIVK